MNLEEKIERKQKRTKLIKKLLIILFIIIILAILGYAIYRFIILKPKQEQNIQEATTEIDEKESQQIEGINNGKNIVEYKGYLYENADNKIYKIKNDGSEKDVVIEQISKSSYAIEKLWVYKDSFYVQADNSIKTFNLDGSGEKELIPETSYTAPEINFEKQQIYYFKEGKLNVTDLEGNLIKKISCAEENPIGNEILYMEDSNIYYYNTLESDSGELLANIYSIDVEKEESKKIQTEILAEDSYSANSGAVYQLETYEDYIYYIAGSQQGTGNFFYGQLYKMKKDGSEHEDISIMNETDSDFEPGVISKFVIHDGILYYDKNKIDLKDMTVSKDNYVSGDMIDEDGYIYTTSFSDDSTINLVKYKVGTDYEDKQVLFTQEIPAGQTNDASYTKINILGKYVCLSVEKKDMETGAYWTGQTLGYDNYLIKKDGSKTVNLNT